MPKTFAHNNKIYSVDFMFAYLNIFGHEYKNIPITKDVLDPILKNPSWQDDNNNRYSPMDVLENPKKYKKDMKRIKNANLNYPNT